MLPKKLNLVLIVGLFLAIRELLFNFISRCLEVFVPECHFPENQIFPAKIWEISRPQHSGISSSRSSLSPENETGIPELEICI